MTDKTNGAKMTDMIRLSVRDAGFSYGKRDVFNGVNLELRKGQFVSILGPNGAGKSTLFKCMLGQLSGYKGEIAVCGDDIASLRPHEIAARIAYTPQAHSLPPYFRALDIALMGAAHRTGLFASPGAAEREFAGACLERLGVGGLANRSFGRLSGGERQLVLLARSLVQRAKILVMDEPTANLDFGNQIRVLAMAKELTGQGYSVIQSTHNPEQAYSFSDWIVLLKGGGVIASGAPKDVVNGDLISEAYGIRVEVESLRGDSARACITAEATARGRA